MVLATLLHKTDSFSNSASESAFDAYFIAKRFNISDEDAQKIYTIVETSDLINKFMSTNKKKTVRFYRRNAIVGNERQDIFDLLVFKLKEGNTIDLAQMLYSIKEQDGLTRYLDIALKKRVQEIKVSDFTLPQTSQEEYFNHAKTETFNRDGKEYKVSVVKSEDIENFYAFIHTPEAGYATGGSREANFANFNIFKNFADNKIICTSFVSNNKASLVHEHHNGFIFEVANDKQYIGYGLDIGSMSKNIPDMLIEYLRPDNKNDTEGSGVYRIKYKQRTMISDNLKSKLYGVDYLSDDLDIVKKKSIDTDYVSRLDNIKQKLGNKTMTIEDLEQIDPEFAKTYNEFFSEDINQGYNKALLNKFHHNEVLVFNPKINAIFTDNISNIPEEYLIKAQEENLPIIIFGD